MTFPSHRIITKFVCVCVLAVGIVSFTGCLGGVAQLLHVLIGHKVPAAYSGLEGKRVAVVCVSDASAYGRDTLTYTVNKAVSLKLAQSVKNIRVVPAYEIEEWIDTNGWDETDFVKIGRGVNADMVLAIEISSYSIHEGATMYKGRSDLTATVYDIANDGQVTYVHGPKHFEFPEMGRPAIQTSDQKFEAYYLAHLTQHITRQFYDHDQLETVAEDAAAL